MDLAERRRQFEARRQREFEEQLRASKERATVERSYQDAAVAVLEGRRPSLKNLASASILHVVDPHEQDQFHAGWLPRAPRPRPKLVNLRDDPVGVLHRRGKLGEAADAEIRLQAARRMEGLYEMAAIGALQAIDPGKDVIDGGGFGEPDTERRMAAQQELDYIAGRLGEEGAELVELVLWSKMTIIQVAMMYGVADQQLELKFLGRLFRGCLDTCAICFELKARPARGVRRELDEFDAAAKLANEPRQYDEFIRAKRKSPRPDETYRAARRNAARENKKRT
jgi:hypothetical protein